MTNNRFIPVLAALALAGCAHDTYSNRAGERSLREARSKRAATQTRAALYLQAAAESAPKPGQATSSGSNLDTYNAATGELTALLRTAEGGRLWNQPLTVSANGGAPYKLQLQPGNKQGLWSPNYFTSFVPAKQVAMGSIKHRDRLEGIGGTLVGIRKETPRQTFAPKVGITAPVTATLDFHGKNATLALHDPNTQTKAQVAGISRPLAADFSAPLAYYPQVNETIAGIMGAISVGKYMDITGLYLLRPYDPNKIPVIFVHGLISTPRMWRNVINELETDPILRSRYQPWVFAYPTGNPVAYSAYRFREELVKAKKIYGFPKGFVLVGHSMGGIVSRMQGGTATKGDWDRIVGSPSEKALMAAAGDSGLIHDCLLFNANPDLRRTVFICTPHRGSDLAIQGIGQLGMRLISLPGDLVNSIQKSAGNVLATVYGKNHVPNSVTSLSPHNPALKVFVTVPYNAPYHTIYGNRGKSGPPAESSDGVVPYWSSHLDKPVSELGVPGPHGACELPETIAEIKRILLLHLKTADSK